MGQPTALTHPALLRGNAGRPGTGIPRQVGHHLQVQDGGRLRFTASEVERDQYLAAYAQKFPDLPIIDLPPVGPHWIVDEVDLPGGGISDDNEYFFNAWVWTSAGRVDVDIPKARDEHRRRLVMAKRDELRRLEEAMDIADGPEHARLAALESNLRAFRPGSFNLAAYDTPDALKAAWPSELPPREA